MKTKTNIADIAVSLSFIASGLFFLFFSFSIDEEFAGDGLGPRFVPQVTACLIIVFALFLVIKALRSSASKRIEQPIEKVPGSTRAALLPLAILALGFFYVLMFHWFGYLLGTLICAIPIYYVFGNRGMRSLVILPLIFITAFYVLFFIIMKSFDVPGVLLDTSPYFPWK